MKEEWRQLKNHSNYLISSFGRIKNITTNKIYSGTQNNCGYIRFDLSENGKRFVIHGHRAVAEAFIPNPNNKPFINHIDGDKTNNNIANLEWCTQKENISHMINVLKKRTGGRNKRSVVCVENGFIYESATLASLMFCTHNSHIINCCNGKRKTTLGYHFNYYK